MFLIKRGLNEEEIKLSNVGRHFILDKCWIVLGRDEKESDFIETLKTGEIIIPNVPGPSAVILDKCKDSTKDKIKKLINAYSKGGDRKKFHKYLL